MFFVSGSDQQVMGCDRHGDIKIERLDQVCSNNIANASLHSQFDLFNFEHLP